ncbi:MAG: PLP-dependent transferase, partial [Pseudomonadota bacterium]
AAKQMNAFGGMLSFRLSNEVQSAQFLERLHWIMPAVSLGGVESTVCQPARTSHAKLSEQQRQRLGMDDRLMRLSVGIEAANDLIADLDQALSA